MTFKALCGAIVHLKAEFAELQVQFSAAVPVAEVLTEVGGRTRHGGVQDRVRDRGG